MQQQETVVREGALREAITLASDDAIIATGIDGTITSWNPAAEGLFGYSAEDATGQSIRLILPVEYEAEERQLRDRAHRGESVRDIETVRRRRDGVCLPVFLTIVPVRTVDGEVIGTVRILRDLTDRARSEHAGQWLAAIVQSSDDAIVSKDLQGIVTSWNDAAERMFGYTPEEIVGRSIRTIIPDERRAEEDEVLARICRGEKVDHFETIRRRKDGSLLPISLTVSPIYDRDGRVIGASKIARDISERRRTAEERERLLALTQEQAAVTDTLNRVSGIVSSTLERHAIMQTVIDAATVSTGATFGALFYNAATERERMRTLSAIAGRSNGGRPDLPVPPDAVAFGPLFRDTASGATVPVIRRDDVTGDTRYGEHAQALGLPSASLSGPPSGPAHIRSYLAVPVKTRSGDVLGGLFFGHPDAAHFTALHERLAAGIAASASLALENARLYLGVQNANRLKDEFLATLSHELRTPLNAILGYSRMLHGGVVTPLHWDRAVETIERNARSLAQIVEDLLDVSRFMSGKMRLNVLPVDLPDTVRHAVEAVVPAAEAKRIRVELVIDPRELLVSGDRERLQQIVWNLLSNAVKFTPTGGHVQVRVERQDSHVDTTVSDSGVGIAEAFLPHVFEHFRQEDAGPSRERGGLGLGLGIARQLVEMHGGTIHVSSAGQGRGSTFSVRLPLIAPPRETSAHDARTAVSAPCNGVDGRGIDGRMASADLRGVRVLAVDDDRDARTLVRDILEVCGAEVVTASSAIEALAMAEARPPDVLLADIGLPRMDGFELIARMRQHQQAALRTLPAAALTAYARSQDRAKALQSGFHLHLAKPIDPSELTAAIALLTRRPPR